MKKIIYILLILLVAAAMVFGRENNKVSSAQKTLVVRAVDLKLPVQSLETAAGIIAARLKSFGFKDALVQAVPGKMEIHLLLNEDPWFSYALKMATLKGRVGFFETFDYRTVSSMTGAVELLKMFPTANRNPNSAQLGCTTPTDFVRLNEALKAMQQSSTCRFLWSQADEDPEICLYAIRLSGTREPLLTGADLESVTIADDASGKPAFLNLQFRQSAIADWARITRNNIGKAIACVLDDTVIFAPVVQVEITGGKTQLSGKFSAEQLRYMAAMAGNGELPCAFETK